MNIVKEKDGDIGIHPDFGDGVYVGISHGIDGDRRYGNIYINLAPQTARQIAQEILKKLDE